MPPNRQKPPQEELPPWERPANEGPQVPATPATETVAPPATTAVAAPKPQSLAPAVLLHQKLNDKGFMQQLAAALPKHMTPERMARVIYTGYRTTPMLQQCAIDSILMCTMEAAQVGLEPNAVTGLAYLVPYKNKKTDRYEAQLILGYKGKIELARRSGQVLAVWAEVVHEKDEFEVQYGLHPDIKHKKSGAEDPGPLTHAYAVAILKGTDIPQFAVLNRREVMKRKASSRAAGAGFSPWQTHEEQMWLKSAIHQLCKLLPLSPEHREVIDRDEMRDMGFMQGNDIVDVPEDPNAKTTLDDFVPAEGEEYGREGTEA